LVPDWQPTREQVLWIIRIAIVLVVVLGILTLIGLPFGITLWEWLKLLIVPAVIAAGGLWFSRQQRNREMEIAEQRAQDEALQAYLDQMSQLLTDKERPLHRAQARDSLSTVARARTLTVLSRMEKDRKRSVVQFLYESGLIKKNTPVVELHGAHLGKANLRRANLLEADLSWADLSRANLSDADLSGADLRWTELSNADLRGANLRAADLGHANLRSADLRWAYLREADLREAHLGKANLHGADLRGANLGGADLSWTELSRVSVTQEQLDQTKSLEGATMPNGQKYAEWLKDKKGRGEVEENSGPS
jgi:uncharacterized protein YjbI with pentapeptide repeats